MCSGDRYLDLVKAIEDPAQGTLDTTVRDAEQIQVSRHLHLVLVMLTEDAALRIVQAVHDSNGAAALRLIYRRYNPLTQERMLAKLNEVLQVDLGTDETTYMDNVVQWDQRTFTSLRQCHEKRCQTSSEEPSPRRDHSQQSEHTC